MAVIDDVIDKLQTPEGKKHARLRATGGQSDISQVQSFVFRADHYRQMATRHEKNGDKHEARINYRQAMLSYERAGVFSMAKNVAEILGDKEMQETYRNVLIHVL